jgi:hypothetical protein
MRGGLNRLLAVAGVAVLATAGAAGAAGAETIQADLDGDGVADTVTAQTDSSYELRVTASLSAPGSAASSEQAFSNAFPYEPWFERVRNVDGRPGAELFVHTGHISTDDTITVLSVARGSFVRSGSFLFNAGLGDDYAMGFRCTTVRGGPGIVAYDFGLLPSGGWMRRVRAYRWHDGTLARVGRAHRTTVGHPPAGERRIGC